jgi:hypothetical protein
MIVACMRARWDTLLAECDAITAKLAEVEHLDIQLMTSHDGVEALDQRQGSLARIRGFTKLVRDIRNITMSRDLVRLDVIELWVSTQKHRTSDKVFHQGYSPKVRSSRCAHVTWMALADALRGAHQIELQQAYDYLACESSPLDLHRRAASLSRSSSSWPPYTSWPTCRSSRTSTHSRYSPAGRR